MTSAGERDGHVQLLLGAYLLGGLPAGEAAAVREHLDRCASCRTEHDDLACVPAWLDLLPAAEAPGGPGLGLGFGLGLGLGLVSGDRDDDTTPGVQSDPSG